MNDRSRPATPLPGPLALLPLCAATAILAASLTGCGGARDPGPTGDPPATAGSGAPAPPAGPGPVFRDITAASGLRFRHRQSRGGRVDYLPETLGPGIGALDYDGDGFLDLFFVQGGGDGGEGDRPRCELYRQGPDPVRFREVAALAGAAGQGRGQSCLVLDHDGDGYDDLLVTHYNEPIRLLANNGDGTFREIPAARSGLVTPVCWQVSATAFDLDRDGDLDIYLGNYVSFKDEHWLEKPTMTQTDQGPFLETMVPGPYAAEANVLYRNDGGSRFTDVTATSVRADPVGRSLAALAADFDGDGWTDIFVANDVSPCALLVNQRDGTLLDRAPDAWLAEVRGSMGIALGDVNRDRLPDFVVTHWVGDAPALYLNQSRGDRLSFTDHAMASGLTRIPADTVGWAVAFLDLDNDGREGVLMVNGHTNHPANQPGRLSPQQAILMDETTTGQYVRRDPAGEDDPLARRRQGRSAVFADLDHDGATDVVVGNNNDPGEIWQHRGASGSWIQVQLVGVSSNRNGLGSHLELLGEDGSVAATRQTVSGDSFFASSLAPVAVGLGKRQSPVTLRIRWLSGRTETFGDLAVDRIHRLVEGTGPVAGPAEG